MVQTEGIQTKEVIINKDKQLLGYITNYFTNFYSQVPKHVCRKKNILLLHINRIYKTPKQSLLQKHLNVTGKI
jgi:hypothetical protein